MPARRSKLTKVPSKTKGKVRTRVFASGNNEDTTSNGSANPIAECFLNAQLKGKLIRPQEPELPPITEDSHGSDCIIIEDHNISFNRPAAMFGQEYGDYLRKMLGIKKVDASTVSRCVFVTKPPPEPLEWLPEYNSVDPKDLALEDFELQCIREKLNAVYMIGPASAHCECGLLNQDPMFDFGDDDFDFDVEIEAPLPPNAESSNPNKYDSEISSHCWETMDLELETKEIPPIQMPNEIPEVGASETGILAQMEMPEEFSKVQATDKDAKSDSSSEDDWFPPSPEIPKRPVVPVKKKFLFKKKLGFGIGYDSGSGSGSTTPLPRNDNPPLPPPLPTSDFNDAAENQNESFSFIAPAPAPIQSPAPPIPIKPLPGMKKQMKPRNINSFAMDESEDDDSPDEGPGSVKNLESMAEKSVSFVTWSESDDSSVMET
jgi:hypothetical protein